MITKAQLIPFSTSVFIWYNNSDQRLCVPFDPDNTDYQQFKRDLANGVVLDDAEGNAMTAEQIAAFLQSLA